MEKPVYHVVVQGVHHGNAFAGDLNKEMYWERILRYREKMGLKLYAFSIFDNHAHFLIRGTAEEVSGMMRRVGVSYSHWYRRQYNHEGSLFRGRPAMQELESDHDILKTVRYIHQEPVVKGLVTQMDAYPFSSYWMYQKEDSPIDKDEVMERLRFWGRFEDYMSIHETGMFLEEKEAHFGLTNEEVAGIIRERMFGHPNEELITMPVPLRNYMLAVLRFVDKISIMQLSTISGVGRGIVQRITMDDMRLTLFRGTCILHCKGEGLPREVIDDYRHWFVLSQHQSLFGAADLLIPHEAYQAAWSRCAERTLCEPEHAPMQVLKQENFRYLPMGMLYTERSFQDGRKRRGLIGRIDLESFSYAPDSKQPIRLLQEADMPLARAKADARSERKMELGEVMLAVPDLGAHILDRLSSETDRMQVICDLRLPDGGRMHGCCLTRQQQDRVYEMMDVLDDPGYFASRFFTNDPRMTMMAVQGGDALAAAAIWYEQLKVQLGPAEAKLQPARYVTAELIDAADECGFLCARTPVVKGCTWPEFLEYASEMFPGIHEGEAAHQEMTFVWHNGKETGTFAVPFKRRRHGWPPYPLTVLMPVLKAFASRFSLGFDYVDLDQADQVACEKDQLAFSWIPVEQKEIYQRVLTAGLFPRHAFRIESPRYYMEGRYIQTS